MMPYDKIKQNPASVTQKKKKRFSLGTPRHASWSWKKKKTMEYKFSTIAEGGESANVQSRTGVGEIWEC